MSKASPSLRFEQITGLELRMVKRETGHSLEDMAKTGDLEVAYVLRWLAERRNGNPDMPFEEVLELPLEDVLDGLEGADVEDPPKGGNGNG